MNDSLPHGIFDPPIAAKRLRIYVGESDKDHGTPLYEAIVRKAREMRMAGATVLRSPMGFGASSRIHTMKILRLSQDLPFIVEIVDSESNVRQLLPWLRERVSGGLITIEDVGVIHYHPGDSTSGGPA